MIFGDEKIAKIIKKLRKDRLDSGRIAYFLKKIAFFSCNN